MGQNKWWYSKIIHIWNRVRLSLRGKKIIVNQILFSKIYQNGNRKKEYTIFSGTGKNTTSQTPRSTPHLDERTRYFRHRHTIKLYKNKMDTKVIKSYQSSLERSTSPCNLIVLNSTKLSKSFHGQTTLSNIIFSVLISAVKLLLIGLRMLWWIAIYFLFCINFSLPLHPAIHRMGNASNILCPRCKEQKESQPYFIFYFKFSKITLRLHQWTNQSEIRF